MTTETLVPTSHPHKDRRRWLIAFGVGEILIACFLFVMFAFLLLSLLLADSRPQARPTAMAPATMFIVSAIFYGGIAAAFLALGVGSIRCRNWARVGTLVLASLWLFVGIFLAAVMVLMVPRTFTQQTGAVANRPDAHLVLTVMTVTTILFMVVLPVVYLIVYTRQSVRATCLAHAYAKGMASDSGEGAVSAPTPAAASKVPIAVAVLAVWQGLGVSGLIACAFVRAVILFGFVFHGYPAFVVFLFHSTVSGYAAWAIYKRKFLGWAIALLDGLFWTASQVATLATRHDLMQLYREMELSDRQMALISQSSDILWIFWAMGLLAMIARLALVIHTKRYFSLDRQRSVGLPN